MSSCSPSQVLSLKVIPKNHSGMAEEGCSSRGSSIRPAGVFADHFPLDTVANVSDLWIWTGEFVGACTRRGKMPVLYQSYGLPGGPERGKKYQGKRFHDDLTIQPIGPGVLGREYLGQISGCLQESRRLKCRRIVQAAEWWQRASSNSTAILVTGHMFPRHAQDPRTIPCGRFEPVPAWEDTVPLDTAHPPEFVLYLGYQFGPRKLVDWASTSGRNLFILPCSRSTVGTGQQYPVRGPRLAADRRLRPCAGLRCCHSARERRAPGRHLLGTRVRTGQSGSLIAQDRVSVACMGTGTLSHARCVGADLKRAGRSAHSGLRFSGPLEPQP